ncbi:MAG TPA: hypothetical protein VHZ55_09785 [Bryobacteraceae bacterium]|nr:hypothetical protein [Bryobacteraceae bacterium]
MAAHGYFQLMQHIEQVERLRSGFGLQFHQQRQDKSILMSSQIWKPARNDLAGTAVLAAGGVTPPGPVKYGRIELR